MAWLKQWCLSWIILSAACVSCQELTSTLHDGNRTCPGEEVTFTCIVRGPSSLSVIGVAWSSTEYIGQDGSLQLSTANVLGHVETSTGMDGNITATATVTNNINIAGELILETTLRITAVEASTVTCRDPNQGPESIEFTISAVPGVPQRISATEISRPRDNICVILVTWDPPANSGASDIDLYIIYVPSRNIREVSSSTVSTLTVPNCGVDTRVQVAAMNHFGCEGLNSSEVQLPAGPTDDGSTTTEGGSTSTSSQLGVGAAVGITIAVILPTLFFLGLVFGYIFYVRVAGKATKVEEVLLHEVSMIRQVEFQKNLVDFYRAFKKDLPEEVKLSSVESLSQMMENQTSLSKLYIKEAVKIVLQTIKMEDGKDVKDKDTDMDSLIRAAENNKHEEVFDELIEIMDNTEPEVVEGLLLTMCKELMMCKDLQIHLQSKASSIEMKRVTDLPGRTSYPNSKDDSISGQGMMDFPTK